MSRSRKGPDELQLDGGNDNVRLGAGDDTIDLDNFLAYQTPGLGHINAGAGFDRLDLSIEQADQELTHGLVINLNKKIDIGAFSIQVTGVEEIIGTKFGDNITGTDGDDVLYGGGGTNTLTGGDGADVLVGDIGARDIFIYHRADNSPAGNGRDMILDFDGHDVIDLSLIDPGTKHHKFNFVGDAPLKHAGDLRAVVHNEHVPELAYTMIQANLDNDKAPEFEIKIIGDLSMNSHDFLL
jgi:Ca2+-binding RTX toxin-like protein